jgi:hypothetical protein
LNFVIPLEVDLVPVEGGEPMSPPEALVAGAEQAVGQAETELAGYEEENRSVRSSGRLGGFLFGAAGGFFGAVKLTRSRKGKSSKKSSTPNGSKPSHMRRDDIAFDSDLTRRKSARRRPMPGARVPTRERSLSDYWDRDRGL